MNVISIIHNKILILFQRIKTSSSASHSAAAFRAFHLPAVNTLGSRHAKAAFSADAGSYYIFIVHMLPLGFKSLKTLS